MRVRVSEQRPGLEHFVGPLDRWTALCLGQPALLDAAPCLRRSEHAMWTKATRCTSTAALVQAEQSTVSLLGMQSSALLRGEAGSVPLCSTYADLASFHPARLQ